MPNLTVVIPAGLVTELTTIAETLMTQRDIDFAGMTATQKGQRFLAEMLKDQLVIARRTAAEATAGAAVNAAQATAADNVAAAEAAGVTAAAGITG